MWKKREAKRRRRKMLGRALSQPVSIFCVYILCLGNTHAQMGTQGPRRCLRSCVYPTGVDHVLFLLLLHFLRLIRFIVFVSWWRRWRRARWRQSLRINEFHSLVLFETVSTEWEMTEPNESGICLRRVLNQYFNSCVRRVSLDWSDI